MTRMTMMMIKMTMTWKPLGYLRVDGSQKSTLTGTILLCCPPAAQIIIVIIFFVIVVVPAIISIVILIVIIISIKSMALTWQHHNRRRRKRSRNYPPPHLVASPGLSGAHHNTTLSVIVNKHCSVWAKLQILPPCRSMFTNSCWKAHHHYHQILVHLMSKFRYLPPIYLLPHGKAPKLVGWVEELWGGLSPRQAPRTQNPGNCSWTLFFTHPGLIFTKQHSCKYYTCLCRLTVQVVPGPILIVVHVRTVLHAWESKDIKPGKRQQPERQ